MYIKKNAMQKGTCIPSLPSTELLLIIYAAQGRHA